MNIDIKPCPFCGETPDVYLGIKSGAISNVAYVYVVCRKCEYRFESETVQAGTPINRLANANNTVITKWNERVNNE